VSAKQKRLLIGAVFGSVSACVLTAYLLVQYFSLSERLRNGSTGLILLVAASLFGVVTLAYCLLGIAAKYRYRLNAPLSDCTVLRTFGDGPSEKTHRQLS
jgi:hypothetical protein